MDGPGLSARERRSLGEIEAALRSESAGLDRRLRELRVGRMRLAWEACGTRGAAVAAFAALSVALLVAGIRTGQVAVVWAFSASWTLTLCGAFSLLCSWAEAAGRPGGSDRVPPGPLDGR